MIGRTLSHYEITAKLGEGGMGEVWQATDTRLDREVALKILPEEFATDPDRLERFTREAKAVAALNHPNIVTIHSVEEADGVHLLTMEKVAGKSLDQLLPPGGFDLEQLFSLGSQIADAVAAAHEQGIVHRDLKPANVMVTDGGPSGVPMAGRVKILDFGLAKLAAQEVSGEEATITAGVSDTLTEPGMVLGTVPYMSPEQVQGLPADHRSDIFSLGILLYEMATGQRPFRGDNTASVMSAILKDQPPAVTELQPGLPNHLGRIMRRCLEKQPDKRYQSALEVRNELQDLETEVASDSSRSAVSMAAEPTSSGVRWKASVPVLLAFAVLAIAVVAAMGWWTRNDLQREGDSATSAPEGVEAGLGDSSIAVLPFTNRSADPDTRYFVDGVHDDLLTQLASIPDLKVISRTSVLEYRDTTKNMRQIGQELGVGHLLEGSVQRAGERVRINVKLIYAEDDEQRWSDTFDRDLSPENILAIQTEIAEAIAIALETTLSGTDGQALARAPTQSQQAYDLYQQARAIPSDSGRQELSRAIELARRAVDLDPGFALAMGEIARCYQAIYWFSSRLPEHREAAQLWLDRALAIAPDDPRLQYELAGLLYHGYLDYDAALDALDKAQAGLPGASHVYHSRGAILRRRGDFEGSFAAYDKALLLDPRDVFSVAHHIWTYLAVGDVEGGRRISERVRSFPNASDIHLAYTHLVDLYLLGDTRPMAEFLRRHQGAELGSLSEFPFLVRFLERRYEDALALLDESPDPIRSQSIVWPHSYLRARLLHAKGHLDAARVQAELAIQELTALARVIPDEPDPIADRALMWAILGDEEAARTDARRAKELLPVEKDAIAGPDYVAYELRTLAVFAPTEELAERLERYLALESKLYYVDYLLLDPVFDRHRDHPAIQALQESYSLREARS